MSTLLKGLMGTVLTAVAAGIVSAFTGNTGDRDAPRGVTRCSTSAKPPPVAPRGPDLRQTRRRIEAARRG